MAIKANIIESIVNQICDIDQNEEMVHFTKRDVPMPSVTTLSEIMNLLKGIIFPGYFLESDITLDNLKYYTGSKLDKVLFLLTDQIKRGYCFACELKNGGECKDCETKSKEIACEFIKSIPELRRLLSLDVQAAFEGDPAVDNMGEIIFCYPSLNLLTYYRAAHVLFQHEVPLIPRIITEMGHSQTGIDIHPQAKIGEKFFMDHGTGIVIGGTCIIGKNVRIYQGVTLGAKSFPLDTNGNPIKGIPRHPIIEDNVIIYSGATILGRITIGKGSVIGGNVWLTKDVPPNSKVFKDTN